MTVADLVPGLDIVNSADVATTAPGATVHYTVTVTNTGQSAYTGAAFTDPLGGVLDDATFVGTPAATAGSAAFTSPNLTWTGNLAVGAAATITFSVTINSPDTGNAVLASTITSATAGSNCAPGSTDADCTATVKVAQLTLVNAANVASTTPGGVVRYTATFTNTGAVPYAGITVAAGAADVFDDATPNGDQTATSGTLTLTSSGVSLDRVHRGRRCGDGDRHGHGEQPRHREQVDDLHADVQRGREQLPGGGSDPRCSVTVTVQIPALTIVKTANATSAVPGAVIGFTVTVTNTGQAAYTGAVVTDSFAQMVDDASYAGGATTTAGSLSYTSPNLTWTGNLAVGASATISYSVTVNNPDTGDKLVINTVTSAAAGATCPPGTTSTSCRITIPVLTPALTIAASAGVATTTPGAVVAYTITVTDSGQTPYTGATFTDPLTGVLDDATYNGDAAATGGTAVSFASPNLTWTGNLAAGGSATITYSVTVHSPDTGDGTLTNTVTSATAGSNCAAGSTDPRCTVTVTVAQLAIVDGANVSTTTPGGIVRYTATFTNTGAVPYTGITITVNAADVFDDAVSNGNETATSGTLTVSAPSVLWTGNIPVGGAVTITGTVTVNNPDTGNKTLASTVTTGAAGSNCPPGGTDPACTATVTVLTPGADDHQDRERVHGRPRVGRGLHDHGRQHRADPVYRGCLHRRPVRGAGRRQL